MYAFVEYTLTGITVGAFYALVALGFTLVFGILRLINFAQGTLSMVGAYIGYTCLVSLGVSKMQAGPAIAITLVVAIVGTVAINIGILRFAYMPMLKRRSHLGALITTLAMSIFLQEAVHLIYGAIPLTYPTLLSSNGVTLGKVTVSFEQIALVSIAVAVMIALLWFTERTVAGTSMRALALDHDAARLMGINVDRAIRLGFIIGGTVAATAGVLLGVYYAQINYMMGFDLGLYAFCAAVVGGIGSVPGAMVGGLIIGLLQAYFSGYVSGEWQDVLVFGVLIGTITIRPAGIFRQRLAQRA